MRNKGCWLDRGASAGRLAALRNKGSLRYKNDYIVVIFQERQGEFGAFGFTRDVM